jgi:small-conductance mechanosensitive channel
MATKTAAPKPIQHSHGPAQSLAAAFIFLAMLLAAFSLWTAIPLSWIYIASKLSQTQFPSGGPYAIVAVGFVATVLIVAWLIGRLNSLYIRLTGTNRLAPIRPTWLKSMRDTAPIQGSVTVVEAVLMSSVLLAGLALTVWFFLLAGSPIPNQ